MSGTPSPIGEQSYFYTRTLRDGVTFTTSKEKLVVNDPSGVLNSLDDELQRLQGAQIGHTWVFPRDKRQNVIGIISRFLEEESSSSLLDLSDRTIHITSSDEALNEAASSDQEETPVEEAASSEEAEAVVEAASSDQEEAVVEAASSEEETPVEAASSDQEEVSVEEDPGPGESEAMMQVRLKHQRKLLKKGLSTERADVLARCANNMQFLGTRYDQDIEEKIDKLL